MSWAGEIVYAGVDYIEVCRDSSPKQPLETFRRVPAGPEPTVEWMQGGTIDAANIGGNVRWNEIPVGKRVGINTFELNKEMEGLQ